MKNDPIKLSRMHVAPTSTKLKYIHVAPKPTPTGAELQSPFGSVTLHRRVPSAP